MRRTPRWSRLGRALGVAVFCLVLSAGAAPQNKAGAGRYQQQLSARFPSWDLNGDGFLDKDELGKAFRDKDAGPYDAADVRGQVYGLTLINLPQPALAVNLAVADRLLLSDPKTYAALADYQFLLLADTNNDKKVSQKEFNAWAKGYARALSTRDTALKSLQTAQARLAKAKTAKARQSAQTAVERANANVNQAMTQINAVPVAVRQALNVGLR